MEKSENKKIIIGKCNSNNSPKVKCRKLKAKATKK